MKSEQSRASSLMMLSARFSTARMFQTTATETRRV